MSINPVLKPKRGRPFKNGVSRKSAAEIKRDQRRREKELLDQVRLSQKEQSIYRGAEEAIFRELDEAAARGDEAEAQRILDLIRGQYETIEYNAQIARQK